MLQNISDGPQVYEIVARASLHLQQRHWVTIGGAQDVPQSYECRHLVQQSQRVSGVPVELNWQWRRAWFP